MGLQAKALRIPPLKLRISGSYGKSYREAISKLTEKCVEGIVTGNIYVVDGLLKRWMDKVTEGLNISVIIPL